MLSKSPLQRACRLPVALLASLLLCGWGVGEPARLHQGEGSSAQDDKLFKARETAVSDDLAAELGHLDPLLSGWKTEALQGAAKTAAKAFLKAALENGSRDPEQFGKLLAPTFVGTTALRPEPLARTFDDGVTSAYRAENLVRTHLPPADLRSALDALQAPFDPKNPPHLTLKIITSDLHGDQGLRTEALIQVDGQGLADRLQQNFTWLMTWVIVDEETVQLEAIDLLEFTEAHTAGNVFSEVTEALLGSQRYYESEILQGVDSYVDRYDQLGGRAFLGSQGVTVADINGDGYDDIYICQESGISNRLLLHNPDGTVTDVSVKSGVGILDPTRSALILDLDADGDQDLALAIHSDVLLLYNDGELNFGQPKLLSSGSHGEAFSLSAADPDGDGDLDLYVCRHNSLGSLGANPVPFLDANNGASNIFWRNDGGHTFTNATDDVGLGQNNHKFSFASQWEDFDGDGDLDLFVANDFGRNNLYRNNGGQFTDVGAEVGIAEVAASMGVSCGDFDLDGDMDILVSNMYSAAGRRTVRLEAKFMAQQRSDTHSMFTRTARGNTLFSADGKGGFEDVTAFAGVELGRWSWGSRFIDFNNDGYEDMYIPNGFVTNRSPGDL